MLFSPRVASLVAVMSLIVAATCLALLAHNKWGEDQTTKVSPRTQHDLDSLANTRPVHDTRRDSILLRVKEDSLKRVRAQRKADSLERDALAQRQRADSLAQVASTAEEWKTAHDEREKEARSWEEKAAQKDTALTLEIQSHSRTRFLLAEETARRVHLETVTVPNLLGDIAKLEKPCKVAFIPCPNRTLIGVVSAVGGVIIGSKIP